MFITPALLISTSMSLVEVPSAKARTEREVGEVEPADLGVALDLGGGALALRGVADGEDDVGAGGGRARARLRGRSRCWRR